MSSIWFSVLNSEEKDLKETPFSPAEIHSVPLFGKPIEIGCFSIDAKRKIHFNSSQLNYLAIPMKSDDIHMDLNKNFNVDVHRLYNRLEKMHQTLYWMLHNEKKLLEYQLSKDKLDFITVRGTLKLIACAPYLKGCLRSQWEICASKFGGQIYFCAIDSDFDIEEEKNKTDKQAKFQAWGYKFEQYITTDTIDGKCNIDSKVFQLEEYCVVLKNIIENYSLLYTAEIDAAIPHKYPGPGSGSTACYAEIKTSRIITNESSKYYFYRNKLVTWWAQSYLTGIPEIVCGFRDDNGIVKKLEYMAVSQLPEKGFGMWSSAVCLNFCVKFLNFLKKIVIEDDPNVVYKFNYNGGNLVHCSKIINPSSRYKVIPDWYVQQEKKPWNSLK